jgi:hypothetical protein
LQTYRLAPDLRGYWIETIAPDGTHTRGEHCRGRKNAVLRICASRQAELISAAQAPLRLGG